jgi:hypothetical protein
MVGSTSLPVSSENSQGLDHFIDVFGLHKSLVLIIGNDKNAKKARLPNYDILTDTYEPSALRVICAPKCTHVVALDALHHFLRQEIIP